MPAPRKANPFKAAVAVEPKVKALVFGPSGAGKTHLALNAPGRVACVDMEGGTAFFPGRVPDFDVVSTKSYTDVVGAVDAVAAAPQAYGTLVIDPVTVIYDSLQDAAIAARTAKVVAAGGDAADVDIERREWGRIKRLYKALMTRLVNLPVHVIIVAREKDEVVQRGGETEKVGVKPDAEKGTAYWFDLIVELHVVKGQRVATIVKDRTGTHQLGTTIADPTWDNLFAPILKAKAKGKAAPQRVVPSDDAAAATDAESFGVKLATTAQAAELATALVAAGYDPDELREKRGWPAFVEMPADKVVELTAWAIAKAPKGDGATQNTSASETPASDAQAPSGDTQEVAA